MGTFILEMENITKKFSGVTVLDNVEFRLKKGEVHVLIGENGAGKSTLMKILTGIYQKDQGQIRLAEEDGSMQTIEFHSPKDALDKGISMVFQEFNLMENMTIAENICIGAEPVNKAGILDRKAMNRHAEKYMKMAGLNVSPGKTVSSLTVAQKQCVEIAKCLSHHARILILDEPTSSLSEKEVANLFHLIEDLKKQGVSIVYISHRMEEIFKLGDRITVFRDGQYIDTLNVKDTSEKELVKLIIGREFDPSETYGQGRISGEMILEGKDLQIRKFKEKVNFQLYKGEILGIFGLVGVGRTELARILFGIDKTKEGNLYKNGKRLKISCPQDAIENGIGMVPEDRKQLGLITKMSIRDNLALAKLRDMPWVLKSHEREEKLTEQYGRLLSIVYQSSAQKAERLSGGNQQKVAIAKWLAMNLDVLILDEPTRGVDVGAKAEIYEIMRELTEKGMSIIMISSDLPEILRVSSRVLVMHDGGIRLNEKTENLDQEKIMHAAIS